jgi:hypothetical protein
MYTFLGTYDIQNVVVYSDPGMITVTGNLIEGSTIVGIVVAIQRSNDIRVLFFLFAGYNANIVGLHGGQYWISVFIVEENGLPYGKIATKQQLISVSDGKYATMATAILLPLSCIINLICTFR